MPQHQAAGLVPAQQAPGRCRMSGCQMRGMHEGKPRAERPEGRYRVYMSPCEGPLCDGRLLCLGHLVCVECAALMRAEKTQFESGTPIDQADIYLLTNEGVTG